MFLRPQHFQQQDRYLEALIEGRCKDLRPYAWGFKELTLDKEALALGKLVIRTGEGIFPDGTSFRIPDDDDSPTPLDVPPDVRDTLVLLTLPLRRMGMVETEREGNETVARYQVAVHEVRDTNAGFESSAPIEVGKRRLKLLLEQGESLRDYAVLGVARIIEKRPDQALVLDKDFLPACLDCQAVPPLVGFITEILGLLHQHGEELAELASGTGLEVPNIADFLLLQICNRFEPLFTHLSIVNDLHPETFYSIALQLAGELATFTDKSRRPASFPPYRHDDLQHTFTPLIMELRQAFSRVGRERNAIRLPLQERPYGIRVSPITDRTLLESASFILEVNANVPAELLRSRFPPQVHVGPVERIAQLVNLHLPGIGLSPLPVAPRQLPFHAGRIYFELDRSSEFWKQMSGSGGFAFHVGGEFPGLEMVFWAIKG
jgi:type VI secretion system protein ImpJ